MLNKNKKMILNKTINNNNKRERERERERENQT